MVRDRLYCDFETFSACDLPAAGAWRYAEDPTTEVLCFAWALGDGAVGSWMQGQPAPRAFLDLVAKGQTLWAWSAQFEMAISTLVASRLPWWPKIPFEQWRCSQALAAMCSLPLSLDGCAAALGSPQRKDPEGSKLLTRFSRPRKPTKADARPRITLRDDPTGAAALVSYCRQDVVTERAIHHRLPIQELPPFEQRVWHVDARINRRGVMVDVPMARGALAVIAGAVQLGRAKLDKATGGEITTANQGARIRKFCEARGVPLIDLTADTVAKALRDVFMDEQARAVLEVRASLAKASVAKFRRMIVAASPRDHRVRGVSQYHAAGPGRWGGRIVQFQNLPRPEFKVYDDLDLIRTADTATLALIYPDLMDAMRDAIRPTLRAKDGHVFAIADWAAIEARVLGWMFDEDTYLEAFRNGLDLYKVAAANVFGVAYEDVTDDQRQLGKVIILALGYSMGEDRFYETCTEQYGLDVSRDLVHRAHVAYRNTYRKIVEGWRHTERAAVAAMESGKRTRFGKVCFEMLAGYLTMILPSGRRLFYPDAKLRNVKTKWGTRRQITFLAEVTGIGWMRSSTYGGKLVENADQAIARDILAESLVAFEDAKLPTVFHVHDEPIAEVPIDDRDALDRMVSIMKRAPPWGPGLPLDAKGFYSSFYRK